MRACILNALAQRNQGCDEGECGCVECNRQVEEEGKETNRGCRKKLQDDNLASQEM